MHPNMQKRTNADAWRVAKGVGAGKTGRPARRATVAAIG